MNKAIFLDRDGIVNVERGEYTWRIVDFQLTVGLIDFIREVQNKGYLVIIISNQGGIGKGIYSVNDVEIVHKNLLERLAENNVALTDIYYCPHHPDFGRCLCRKPEPVLLEKAIARYNIDADKSYFIGDSQRDADAGEKVNLNTIKVNPNSDLRNIFDLIL
jgi:D-glycero-D-manno-heptose 1,7-bisphosphate phosphatase